MADLEGMKRSACEDQRRNRGGTDVTERETERDRGIGRDRVVVQYVQEIVGVENWRVLAGLVNDDEMV